MLTSLLLAQSSSPGGPIFVTGGIFFILFMAVVVIASIFWLWMLIDCLTSSLPATEKLLWFLVIFFLHLIGAIVYYVVARAKRT